MRTGLLWCTMFLLAAGESLAYAQPATNKLTAVNSSVTLRQTPAAKPQESSPMVLRLTEPKDTNSFVIRASKTTQVRVSGPLIQPLKAKDASGFVGRVAQWFNPLSKTEPNVPPAPSGPMNTRAWTTIVGWNPGRSAFPDGAWHEPPRLDLVTVTTEKQP